MTEEAVSVEWKTTKNLLEAIVLEANLIKKCQPFFNIKEKDNRSFVYIIIPQTKWPYPRIVRGRELSKFQPHNTFIFGPLQSYSLAKISSILSEKFFLTVLALLIAAVRVFIIKSVFVPVSV